MKRILIPDYSLGNLAAIARMVQKAGGVPEIAQDPSRISANDKIILAGVGAFDFGMQQIRHRGWEEALKQAVIVKKVPVLGICLGFQLMCLSSEEGQEAGLGWLNARVKKFHFAAPSTMKVPHMGWNTLNIHRGGLFPNSTDEQRFYFSHSYYVECANASEVCATSEYGHEFVAAANAENMFGVQFHPEKSHRFGLGLIKAFIDA